MNNTEQVKAAVVELVNDPDFEELLYEKSLFFTVDHDGDIHVWNNQVFYEEEYGYWGGVCESEYLFSLKYSPTHPGDCCWSTEELIK